MITEFIVTLSMQVLVWVASLFPEWVPPEEFETFETITGQLVAGFASVDSWIPWSVIGACVATQVLTWGLVFGIKGIRAAAAHIPGFGGAGD